jgi:hypothetical protein
MTKGEYIQTIIEGVMQIWKTDTLADSIRSRKIWAAKLMNAYSDEEIMLGAEWVLTWNKNPRTIAELYFAMPRWKKEKENKAKQERWMFD